MKSYLEKLHYKTSKLTFCKTVKTFIKLFSVVIVFSEICIIFLTALNHEKGIRKYEENVLNFKNMTYTKYLRFRCTKN